MIAKQSCRICVMKKTTAERIFEVVADAGVKPRSRRSTLAKLCGISVQAVRGWEEGKTANIQHAHLVKIARRYRVSIDYLLGNTDNKKPPSSLTPEQYATGLEVLPASEIEAIISEIMVTLPEEDRRHLHAHLLRLVADDLAGPET